MNIQAPRTVSTIVGEDLPTFYDVFRSQPGLDRLTRNISGPLRYRDQSRFLREECTWYPSLKEVASYYDSYPQSMCIFVIKYTPSTTSNKIGSSVNARYVSNLPSFGLQEDTKPFSFFAHFKASFISKDMDDGGYRLHISSQFISHRSVSDEDPDTQDDLKGEIGLYTDSNPISVLSEGTTRVLYNPNDMIDEDIVHTILDVKTFFNLVQKRAAFCQESDVDYAKRFTIEYYSKWLALLEESYFFTSHLNVYLIYNATVLGIPIPKILSRIDSFKSRLFGLNSIDSIFNGSTSNIITTNNLDELNRLKAEFYQYEQDLRDNPEMRYAQTSLSNKIIAAIMKM